MTDEEKGHLDTMTRHLVGAYKGSRRWRGCPVNVKRAVDRAVLEYRSWLLEVQPDSGLVEKLPTPVPRDRAAVVATRYESAKGQ